MHYAQYKHADPSLVQDMVETFPFAMILVNGNEGPLVAQAPLTFRTGCSPAGAVEFHLALINPITEVMTPDIPILVSVQGPGAAISPSWFTASYGGAASDRSQTAPTYNYVSLHMRGRLEHMPDEALQTQIKDLVGAHEPKDGWRIEELDPRLWEAWRRMIRLYRVEVDSFDLTAKLSDGDSPGDRPGVVEGLRRRGVLDDADMATLVEGNDGTPTSLRSLLCALRSN
jgi:predicted FMN-binding regulatory protein PaiB